MQRIYGDQEEERPRINYHEKQERGEMKRKWKGRSKYIGRYEDGEQEGRQKYKLKCKEGKKDE